MNRAFLSALFLASVVLVTFGVNGSYLGIVGILLSTLGVFTSKNLLTLVLSFLNFSVSVAFDYYLRVWMHGYEFYDEGGIGVVYLCVISTLLYLYILSLDWYFYAGVSPEYKVHVEVPDIKYVASAYMYYPLLIMVIWCSFFVYANAGSMFSISFDLKELKKFSFLEYFSVIIFFLLRSNVSIQKRNVALALCFVLVAVILLASYRMVSIIFLMSIALAVFSGLRVNRVWVILAWVVFYIWLAAISYIRGDGLSIDFYKILGYKEYGYLDNTFTGVIETALIYSSIYENNTYVIRLFEFIGVLLPVPGSFIPDFMVYYNDLSDKYIGRIPGGGLLAGFVIYFDYLLVPFVLLYAYIAYRKMSIGMDAIWSVAMAFVFFVSVSRWWLYGPYVLFRFLGVFLVFLLLDSLLRRISNVSFKT